MCSHHLIEPVACRPASGWEKGQVENQVGNLRDEMFRRKDRTIWDLFEEERASLMQLRGPFDGFVEKAVRASTTCLVTADHNRYSVECARRRPNGSGALSCRTRRGVSGR
jgi:hypothetical protein